MKSLTLTKEVKIVQLVFDNYKNLMMMRFFTKLGHLIGEIGSQSYHKLTETININDAEQLVGFNFSQFVGHKYFTKVSLRCINLDQF